MNSGTETVKQTESERREDVPSAISRWLSSALFHTYFGFLLYEGCITICLLVIKYFF